jgi:hypothetical protein
VRNNPEAGLERAKNRDTHALAALTLLSTEPTFVQRGMMLAPMPA